MPKSSGSLSGVENDDRGFAQSSVGPHVALKPKGRSTEAVAKGARFASNWSRGSSGSVSAFSCSCKMMVTVLFKCGGCFISSGAPTGSVRGGKLQLFWVQVSPF